MMQKHLCATQQHANANNNQWFRHHEQHCGCKKFRAVALKKTCGNINGVAGENITALRMALGAVLNMFDEVLGEHKVCNVPMTANMWTMQFNSEVALAAGVASQLDSVAARCCGLMDARPCVLTMRYGCLDGVCATFKRNH